MDDFGGRRRSLKPREEARHALLPVLWPLADPLLEFTSLVQVGGPKTKAEPVLPLD